MKKLTASLAALFILGLANLYAQQGSIKGTVVDSSNKVNLHQAVISLLRPKDSVLVKFMRTDSKGDFNFQNLVAGKYIMIISYPEYADYVDDLDLSAQPQKVLGNIYVSTKAHVLEEVIVKQRVAAIRMKGDTTEFKADSFYTGPNANVQELLKRMPGMQVNSKGEITAQGQRVEKVLVDGEEFFSDDPAVVTKNLRADIVDKVQVFDKKSDQAVFTGIDDGQTVKTINLQLKEDKKKGYFGKVEAGTDFNQYKYGKAMVNAFKGKRKIAGFITHDNTRFETLNWSEQTNYSGGVSNMEITDDGGIMIFSGGDGDFGSSQGLPRSTTGGLMFSNKWNSDKININGSYQYSNMNVRGRNQTTTQTILPDTTFINTQDENFVNDRKRNRINGRYDWNIDSSSTLKLTLTGSILTNRNASNFLGRSISEEGQIINQSDRTTTNDGEERNMLGSLLWQKRLKKKGRTLSIASDFNIKTRDNNGYLNAKNDFYDKTGALVRQDNLDQLKTNQEDMSGVNAKATYTEPLWKNTFLELNYSMALNRNDAERNTLERSAPGGKYENLVDTLSNHFIYNNSNHTGGFNFKLIEKKYSITVGSAIGVSRFNLEDVRKGNDRTVKFTNFLPSVTLNFNPKKQTRINVRYSGNTRNPSLQQIQPFIDNIDPLNITIGNPNLKQEFRHNVNFSFNDYKVLKSRNIYLSGNFSTTSNAITNANFIDSIGRRINQAINVNGNYSGSMWSSFGVEIAPSLNINAGFSPSISRFVNVVNGQENISKNTALGFNVGLSRWSESKVNFGMNFRAANNRSTSSIRPGVVTQYWSYSSYVDFSWKLPADIYFTTDAQITMYQRTSVFAGNSNVYLVNSSLKKTFGKSKAFEVIASVNDLFNNNQNIQRNISTNFITETSRQNIRRVWLLTLAYNFSKNGKPVEW
jgi:hypothetical protein